MSLKDQILKQLTLTILFLCASINGWAATYYVAPAGTPGVTPARPYSTPQTAAALPATLFATHPSGGPHTVYIAPGSFNSYLDLTHPNWSGSTVIGTAVHGSTLPAAKGAVVINTTTNTHSIESTQNITVKNISATNATAARQGIYVHGGSFVGDNLYIFDTAGLGMKLYDAGTSRISNSLFAGTSGSNLILNQDNSDLTLNNCIMINSANSYAGTAENISNSATLTLNNSIVGGQKTYGINSSGTLTINNSIIYGGWAGNGADPITTSGAGTATVNNSQIIETFYTQSLYSGNVTIAGSKTDTNIGFKRRSRSGFIVPCVDDTENYDYAKTLADILSIRGLKGTFYAEGVTIPSKLPYLKDLEATYPGVMEIGYHTFSHTDMAATGNIWTVSRPGSSLTIDRTGAGTLTYNGGTPAIPSNSSISKNLKAASLYQIKSMLQADGWTVKDVLYSLTGGAGLVSSQSLGEVLDSVTAGTIVPLRIDGIASGYYKTEMADGKSRAEVLLGKTLYSFSTPYGSSNANAEAAALDAGFWSVRSGLSNYDADWLLDNINLAQLSYMGSAVTGNRSASAITNNGSGLIRITATSHGYITGDIVTISGVAGTTEANGTWTVTRISANSFDLQGSMYINAYISGGILASDTATRRHIHSLSEMCAQYGAIIFILGHNTSQISFHDWQIILDAIAEYPEITVTSHYDAVNTIKNGGIWSTVNNRNYTRTWTDQSDFHLLPGSPAKFAGIPVDGVTFNRITNSVLTDSDGRPWNRFTPSIGAYSQLDPLTIAGGTTDTQTLTATGGSGLFTWSVLNSPTWLTVTGSGIGNAMGTVTYSGQPVSGPAIVQVTDGFTTASKTYNGTTVVTAPVAPSIGVASAGNTHAMVSFLTPTSDGGSPIIYYSVTSNPDSITSIGTASPILVTGLTNGKAYSFTVTATNSVGTGPASLSSNSVTPFQPISAPGAPSGVSASAGNGQATVYFTAPVSDGGSTITSYTVTSSVGNIIVTGSSSPINITGLTNGTEYTFTVTSANGVGTGPASAPSNSVIPSDPTSSTSVTPTPVPALLPLPLAGTGLILFWMVRRRKTS